MASITDKYDVVIVGGGISGLYTAWRLASNTTYSIAVLEYSNRFGGRYHTCQMPGGFPAELGAMRLSSKWHPILKQLIEDMDLETKTHHTADRMGAPAYYVKGKLIHDAEDISKIFDLSDSEKKRYCDTGACSRAMQLSENGNFFAAKLDGNSQLARNVTLKQWWGESMNSRLIELKMLMRSGSSSLVGETGILQPFSDLSPTNQVICVRGGMENVIVELVDRLKRFNVTLLKDHTVTRVEEVGEVFRVKAMMNGSTPSWFAADKLIMACNARGLELITWISDLDRVTQLQKLLGNISHENLTKLFLTYNQSWWEASGISSNLIISDLPIGRILSCGSASTAKTTYSTIMVYNLTGAEVFNGMNSENEEIFENAEGEIPPEQVPSKILVQNVQMQLIKIFGTDIPDPVAACVSTWNKDPIAHSVSFPKVGVDHNSLYWRSLRPFGDDSNVFLIGDTFTAVDRKCVYTSWSEGALLTSERVLHKYFGLQPYLDGLCLENPWPEDD